MRTCLVFLLDTNSLREALHNSPDRLGSGPKEPGGWMAEKLPASGLLMSNAKLFHYVFSVALMVLEYLQTAL